MKRGSGGHLQTGWRLAIKMVLDRVTAALGILLLSPILLVVAVTVRLVLGAPVLYRQVRPGRYGRLFQFLKFRTMWEGCGPDGRPLPDDQRLPWLGRFLRSTSLDELPQLWNVLKGDMSLVGPRPLLPQYLTRYTDEQSRRHEVLPGITGWAQVNGRNALSWEDKFTLDIWYVDHWSLTLDWQILLRTLNKVLKREGIARGGCVTMPEFMGTQNDDHRGAA